MISIAELMQIRLHQSVCPFRGLRMTFCRPAIAEYKGGRSDGIVRFYFTRSSQLPKHS